MKTTLATTLFVILSGLMAKNVHAQTKTRRVGACTEARCTTNHGTFADGACECSDAVLCGPDQPLCAASDFYPGPGLRKNFVQLVRERRDHCGCEPEGTPIQCDLPETFPDRALRLLECSHVPTTGNPDDHPGVIPTRLLGLVQAAAAPGGNARLPQDQVGQGECAYLHRMQVQCAWSRRHGCDCGREVAARQRIAAANPPPPEPPPPPPPPTLPPRAEIPPPPAVVTPPEPAPPPAVAVPASPTVTGEFEDGAGEEPAQPAADSPQDPFQESAPPPPAVAASPPAPASPPSPQPEPPAAGPIPPPGPPTNPFGPPPPRRLWEEREEVLEAPAPRSESWMWNRLRLAPGYTYYETRELRTRGGSLEAHVRIAITPLVGLVFGAGAVAASRSVFVDPVGLALNPIAASPNSEARLMVHWAMLAIHKGQTRSRTPRAEGLGGSLVLSHAWHLHRNLRFGLAVRGTILAVRHEDALGGVHGLGYGIGFLVFLDLGR